MKRLLLYLVMVLVAVLVSCEIDDGQGPTDPTDPEEPTEPYITVRTPNNGDSLSVEGSYIITWSSNTTLNLNIDYSTDNGNTWRSVATGVTNNSAYIWNPIPNTLSDSCKVKIATEDASLEALSSGTFSIVEQASKFLRLTSPNGGEVLVGGSEYTIYWTAVSVENISLQYSSNGGGTWNTIVQSYPASSNSYNWTPVPEIISSNCLVKILDVAEASLIDISDAEFSIIEQKEIVVRSPNGGEQWPANSPREIKWFSSLVENVNIDYTIDNGVSWTNIATNVPSTGFYMWDPVPVATSNNAKIKITNADGGVPSDESDNVFSITPEEFLKVTFPNGGERLQVGSAQYITWQSSIPSPGSSANPGTAGTGLMKNDRSKNKSKSLKHGRSLSKSSSLQKGSGGDDIKVINAVQIEYSSNNGADWVVLTGSTPNNGSYLWSSVPNINSDLCVVRISDADDNLPSDISDGSFTIATDAQQEILTVTSPNGGEIYQAGSSQNITWQTTGVVNVKIEYTNNNGIDWITIVESTPSDGFYTWESVPSTVSTNCRVRITDASDGSPWDESDNLFVIAPEPYITITAPKEDDSYFAGASTVISWRSENVALVKIEFTSNGGADWSLITDNEPSDGIYIWENIPLINSTLCRIKISNAASGNPFEISGFFEVTDQNVEEQLIRLIAPNGGEEFEAGTSQNITWESTAIESYDLQYTTDNGNNWVEIASGITGAAYEWGIPIDINSPLTKVRVSDHLDGEPFDDSDGTFTFRPAESITVTNPTAGQVFGAGEPILIEWEATGIENVGIQYTTTNGLGSFDEPPFYTVTASTPNTGSLETSFSIPSTAYYVVVFDAEDAAPQARSIGTFSVTGQVFGSIDIVKPAPNDTVFTGTFEEIKWTSQFVENVKIEYSLNNGATWQTIVENTPSDGSYIWGPIPDQTTQLAAIKISDAERTEVFSIIASPFVIAEQVQQIAGEPASIYLVEQSYTSIGVTESGSPETSQITFEVQDSSGIPIDNAHAVEVSFRFGARPGGGEFLAPLVAQTDEKGRVNVNLSSGTRAGSVQIVAEINYSGDIIRSRPVNIAIHGGLPENNHFSIAPGQLNYPYYNIVNGIGGVTALVGDRYSNPVKPGTIVYFSTEAGVVQGSNITDELGRATATLVSGDPLPDDAVYGPGYFYVTAQTIDENDVQISTSTLVLYSGAATAQISPTSFNIPNGGSVAFSYTIQDINQNPLAPGQRITVVVETSGDAAATGQTFVQFDQPGILFGGMNYGFVVYDTKPEETNPASISVTVSTEGPNGKASATAYGSTN